MERLWHGEASVTFCLEALQWTSAAATFQASLEISLSYKVDGEEHLRNEE